MNKLTILKYFKYDHLPQHLQEVSKDFHDLANKIAKRYEEDETDIAETIAALRKILEAKDCIVRSVIKDK